jgi:hypothetical protein
MFLIIADLEFESSFSLNYLKKIPLGASTVFEPSNIRVYVVSWVPT